MTPSPPVEAAPRRARDLSIDVLKGLLIVGMVLAHTTQLLGDAQHLPLSAVSYAANLVSFSGFLFCFGFATWRAYFSRGVGALKIALSAGRLLLAFYVSGFAYEVLVESQRLDARRAWQIVLLSRLPHYSEFLVAFALLLVAAALLRAPLQRVIGSTPLFGAVVAALLLTTLLPASLARSAQAGLFIGTSDAVAASFPILPYAPLFLLGMWWSSRDIGASWRVTAGALAGTFAFVVFRRLVGVHSPLMSRFPPGLVWVCGSIPLVLLWLCAARALTSLRWPRHLLAPMGANALFYLLWSNLLLFGLKAALKTPHFSTPTTLLLAASVLGIIGYSFSLARPLRVD